MDLLKHFGLFGNLLHVALFAHLSHAAHGSARGDKAAGEYGRAGGFIDTVGFSGQQGFVDIHTAVDDHGICRDLAAGFQDHDIVGHQLVHRNLALHPVADHRNMADGQNP